MTAVPQDPEPHETPADDTCYYGRCRWIDGCNAEGVCIGREAAGALNNKDEPPPA
jgi:hypothetical protein